MLADLTSPIGWTELLKRTMRETMRDDAPGLAAQLAYYFFLALFPALLCVIAVASLFPLERLAEDAGRLLAPVAPAELVAIIQQQMLRISQGGHTGLLSVGLLGALWSSSAAMGAVMNAMNHAYGITESRPWWRVKLTAIALTVGLVLFIVVSFTLVVAGPEIAETLASRLGLGRAFVLVWMIVQWPLAFAMVSAGIGVIYAFAPDADQDRTWITPGSLLATLLWLAGSVGFRFYVTNFGDYEATYGMIGGVILLLLWFYLTGLVIVVGAEMNAEIDRAAPWSAAAAAAAPGARRRIGRAAARAHAARTHASPAAQRPMSVAERIAPYLAVVLRWRNRSRR